MNKSVKFLAATAIAVSSMATSVLADKMETVAKFYELLSNPTSASHQADFKDAVSADWESIGNYSGKNKTSAAFIGQMNAFGGLIPDMNWDVQATHEAGDFVTVRSRATGTPNGPMFGVDGQGRSFDILTIDIHEFKDGKIVRTHHVEDWAGALQQLSGK